MLVSGLLTGRLGVGVCLRDGRTEVVYFIRVVSATVLMMTCLCACTLKPLLMTVL